MDYNRGRNYSRPGRGGFNGRQSSEYGNQRGHNSSSFGRWTWTFYDEDQWRRFKDWLKEDANRVETEKNRMLVKSLAEILQGEKKRKDGKEKHRKKKKEESSDSSDSEDKDKEVQSDSSPEMKLVKKKKSARKKQMDRLVGKLKLLEEENKHLKENPKGASSKKVTPKGSKKISPAESEEEKHHSKGVSSKKSTPKGSKKISPVESDEEEAQDLQLRSKVGEEDVALLKTIEKEFNGTEGTKLLKKFCKENEIMYKNKTEAIWAVLAFKKGTK